MKDASMFNPLQKTRLHEEIVEQLKDKIMSREIVPGDKLPPERVLAETFNVNRSTVREALKKLESMELVEIKHGDGVYVKDYLDSGSFELVKYMLFRDGEPDVEIIRDLSHLRMVLVPEIVSQAAKNRTDADLGELHELLTESSGMSISEKDWRLHNIITRASGNILFTVLLNSFTKLLKKYSYLYFDNEENRKKSKIFHNEIYEAIKAGDPAKAREIAADVYLYAEEAMYKSIEEHNAAKR